MMARSHSSSSTSQTEPADEDDLRNALYRRPGFLIRRAHQIAVSIFLEEAGDLGLTTTQYGALVVLNLRKELDQVGLSTLVGIDRSTTALVVGKLEEAGYLVRQGDPADKRRKLLALTDAGKAILARVEEPARRTRQRELDVFSPEDQKTFLRLLEVFVGAFNAETRAPIKQRGEPPRRNKRR